MLLTIHWAPAICLVNWQYWKKQSSEASNSGLDCSSCKVHICKFLHTNNNLNGADDLMISSETGIEKIFNDEDDNGVFQGFTAKYIATATENKFLLCQYDSYLKELFKMNWRPTINLLLSSMTAYCTAL